MSPRHRWSTPRTRTATKRQRAIERGTRRWKNRTVTVAPDAKQQPRPRYGKWQKASREHLATPPELIRRRERKQTGAGNLPKSTPRPSQDAVEATRVRSGGGRPLPEVSDGQCFDAWSSN
ncbi:hypothetical protein ACPCTO_30280 [Streptomyces olivoreticuli]